MTHVAQTDGPMSAIPVVDLNGLDPADPRRGEIAQALDRAFSEIGFCYVKNLGVDPALLDAVFDASRRFHAMGREDKNAVLMNEWHRGYMPPKTSLIETSTVAKVTKPNFSESFMLMHDVPQDAPEYGDGVNGPNQFPQDLPGFEEAVTRYRDAMAAACTRFRRLIARALGLEEDALEPLFAPRPVTFLRMIHYPSQAHDPSEDQFGSAPHTDYGFITVLAQDDVGGLEVRRRDGEWLRATPMPHTFVVNVGDMLAHMANGRWTSTPHRVRNLAPVDRYSVAFFFDPAFDARLERLPVPGTAPSDGAAHIWGEYLMTRLNKNYAYRKGAAGSPEAHAS